MGTTKTTSGARRSSVPAPSGIRPEELREIRYTLMQTQDEFAEMIGVSVQTLLAWEKGTQRPDGPALALLRVAAKKPKTVAKVLGH
ncbi:MAG: helix-turn-helix domain-containing protein [Thermoanaerobaculia bacterium]|nr:helix-turn-helix domain-containing protein [Thermoanaerobaculia bacterium]